MTRVAQDAAALPGLEARSEAFARRFAVDRMIDAYEELYVASLSRQPAFAVAT